MKATITSPPSPTSLVTSAPRSLHAPAPPVQVRVFIVMSSLLLLLAVMGAGV